MKKMLLLVTTLFLLQGCVSTVVGVATDTAIAVVKVPFKVGGAIVDAVTDDDEEDEGD